MADDPADHPEEYESLGDNIRDPKILGPFIGARVVDITQTDKDELHPGHPHDICLHFDNGGTITFHITYDLGFEIETV